MFVVGKTLKQDHIDESWQPCSHQQHEPAREASATFQGFEGKNLLSNSTGSTPGMQGQVVNVCPQYQSTWKFLLVNSLKTCGDILPNSAAAMRRLAVPTKGSRTRLPPET